MEFSNSGRWENIYQKDTHSSLGEVALKLLVVSPKVVILHAQRSCLVAKP